MSEPVMDPAAEELVLLGRIRTASNATFLGMLGETQVVYKPVAGERPLWDFPDGDLAGREVAAYAVSQALGWEVVPRTWLGEGPHGVGMLQRWCDVDDDEPVTIVPEGSVPDGFRHVFDGYDALDNVVSLVHEDTPGLRRMAVFDAITNNADRKGGHVLPVGGHRYGCDHGLTFHHEPKLRTVLWGWQGEPLTGEETAGVRTVRDGLGGDLAQELAAYITACEIDALGRRCEALLSEGVLPVPDEDRHMIPWPPF